MEDTNAGTGAATVVAAVGDLIFGARIRAAAEAAGVTVHFSRAADDLRVRGAGAGLVLVDLDARWLDAAAAITGLRAGEGNGPGRIIAFVSHVRADAIEAARAAGADRVMARSAFVRELPGIMSAAAQGPP